MLPADGATLPSGAEVARALERVFARPEFRKEPPGVAEWIRQAVERGLKAVFTAIRGLMGDSLTGSVTETLVLIALLLVLGAIVGHLAWSVLQLRVPSDGDLPPSDEGPAGDAAPGGRGAGLDQAARLAESGAYAEAMHALYHGSVTWLDARGQLRRERFKTGADYASDLGPTLRPAFRSLLSDYYPVAFGGRPAGAGEWLAMRASASRLGVPA